MDDEHLEIGPDDESQIARELAECKQCTDACQSLIAEFDEHDPTSQAGRYPEDQRDNQTLDRLEIVDFEALKLGVGKISHSLGTIVEQIAGDHEWESEVSSW